MRTSFNHSNLMQLPVCFIMVLAVACDSPEKQGYDVLSAPYPETVYCNGCKAASFTRAKLDQSVNILERFIEKYNETSGREFLDKRKYLPDRDINRKYFVIDLAQYALEVRPLLKQNEEEVWISGYIPGASNGTYTCNEGRQFYFEAKVSLAKDSVYEFYHNNPGWRYDESKAWTLVWSEDFNSGQLNSREWTPLERGSNFNHEKQAYTAQNIAVTSGLLELTARKEKWRGIEHAASKDSVEREYTSGEVRTQRAWTYGKFVARMKCANARGMISAFWMTTGREVWPPEIDIAEVLGHDPTTVYFSNHYGSTKDHKMTNSFVKGADLSNDFHEFAVEWEPGAIRWFVDGKMRYQTTENIPSEPFYLRFSLPVGAEWSGNPDASSIMPASLYVDWLKVYQRCNSIRSSE
jgi:hypothetical protein